MTVPISRRAWGLGAGAAWLASSLPVSAAETSFAAFVQATESDARSRGVSASTLNRALVGLTPNDKVITLDRRQASGKASFRRYRDRIANRQRIDTGRARYRQHQQLLESVGQRFGVSPRVIVALWGIESSFGSYTGDFHIVRSLATLSWDGRRRELFYGELIGALEILDRTPLEPERLTGSWAGAMGQAQFLPTTYLNHAVDADSSGWSDIWNTQSDVFSSMANYLRSIGWNPDYRWGREVRLPAGGNLPSGLDFAQPLAAWRDSGVRRADGGELPVAPIDASLIITDDGAGPSFLVYDNFRVLRTWNRSTNFALTVGLLSDMYATA